jgi:hypothetical protein
MIHFKIRNVSNLKGKYQIGIVPSIDRRHGAFGIKEVVREIESLLRFLIGCDMKMSR